MLLLFFLFLFGSPLATRAQTNCTVNGIYGTCMLTRSCQHQIVYGHCPGSSLIQCCVRSENPKCIADGRRGRCVEPKSCAGISVPDLSYSRYCSSVPNSECCLPDTSPFADDGPCGKYYGAVPFSLMGGDGFTYSVVKILPEHLDDPTAYTEDVTVKDNTMTGSVACAFDRMATIAKRGGVDIRIVSGFRSRVRQNYLYNCTIHRSCKSGEGPEHQPSKAGTNRRLTLNVECVTQIGPEPNCGSSDVYQWLHKNAQYYGFTRPVRSEPWLWEHREI